MYPIINIFGKPIGSNIVFTILGILASLAVGFILGKGKAEKKRKTAFDIFGVSVPVFYIFYKIGCFLKGCCYGIPFKLGIADSEGVKRLPIAIIEIYLYLLLFLLLLKLFKTKRFIGKISLNFLFWSSLFTFGLEYIRDVKRKEVLFGFSEVQLFSAVVFVISCLFFLFTPRSTFKSLRGNKNGLLPTDKNIFKTILLWLLTFGFYGLVVMTSVSKSINKTARIYDNKKTMNYCLLVFLVGPITLGIGFIVWYYRLTKRVANELSRRNIDYLFTKGDFWLWNILGLMVIVGPLIYLHKLFRAINLINQDYNEGLISKTQDI